MLPPLAILIPRIIRVLELLVELYGIFAPCVGCALRGCFGGCFGCGRDKKKPDDGCDCPPKEQERKRSCFLGRKREGKEKVHREGCPVYKKREEEGKKRHWWQFEKNAKGRKLHKSPPPSRGLDLEEREDADAELEVLQRQYSSLPQPPPPAVAAVVVA